MSITYNDLIARAQQVRDESEIGANTATRVGQLLADIIQWCQDNNADLGNYLLNFTAHLNESGGILNWFQSRIVLLKTMGGAYDDVSVGSLSDGDVYYDSQGNWIREKQGSATINGIHPSKGVFYVNLANKTVYQWDGTTFQVAIESGGGGGASTVTAFEGYEVVASAGDLPEQGNPTTGYIVGTHIYAYVGENGDTADGKYQDLGELNAAGVSVTTNGDGTFTIHAGGNDYTVNLNHTHEGMVKLEKYTEATMPQTKDDDIIYVQVDNATTPTVIEALHIFGIEFTGGGAAPGTPRLTSPSPSQISNGINIGNTTSGVANYSLKIKAKDITQPLLVEWGNGSTGYSFNTTNLPAGVTYDSNTGQLTITVAAATSINGVSIPVVYTGSDTDENAEGAIGIRSSSVDGISVEVTLVANKVTYTDLAAVKLTGTQWLQTDYYPNPNTEWELECKLTANSRTDSASGDCGTILRCHFQNSSNERFYLHTSSGGADYFAYSIFYQNLPGTSGQKEIEMREISTSEMVADHAIISYVKGTSFGTFTFNGGTARSVSTGLQTETLTTPMAIGYHNLEQKAFNVFDLTIYELTITENGQTVHHWVPKLRDGVPGLYDTVNHTFISSETATELVAIPLT